MSKCELCHACPENAHDDTTSSFLCAHARISIRDCCCATYLSVCFVCSASRLCFSYGNIYDSVSACMFENVCTYVLLRLDAILFLGGERGANRSVSYVSEHLKFCFKYTHTHTHTHTKRPFHLISFHFIKLRAQTTQVLQYLILECAQSGGTYHHLWCIDWTLVATTTSHRPPSCRRLLPTPTQCPERSRSFDS